MNALRTGLLALTLVLCRTFAAHAAPMLYVAAATGTSVVDTATFEVVGLMPAFDGNDHLALTPDGNRLYATTSAFVTYGDPATLSTIVSLSTGQASDLVPAPAEILAPGAN